MGKLAGMAVVAMLAIAWLGSRLPPSGIMLVVGVIGFIFLVVTSVVVYITVARPDIAVTEGMEVVQLKQLSIGTKGFIPSSELPPIPDPGIVPLDANNTGGTK